MQKLGRKKSNNKGNTFIVIMVTLACMGILVGVILATIGYYYRMKFTDLENRNNFYYVEAAMEEIYTGVGNDSVDALRAAYSDTVAVMVYYEDGRYVKIDTEAANRIMKQKFLQRMAVDPIYSSQMQLYEHLKSFISAPDIELVDPATVPVTEPRLYLEVVATTTGTGPNMVTTYDKLVIHNVTVKRTTSEGYVQSITTDIEITEPEFSVSFDGVDSATNALYDFSMIADMGIEINHATKNNEVVSITGNVYAASDYYNKQYNTTAGTRVSNYYNGTNTDKLAACNGLNDTSRYSGLYVDSSKVSIMAEKVIIPGSISVLNNGNASIMGNIASSSGLAEVWADNIILTSSSVRTVGANMDEASLSLYANAYIADDLEINNDNAEIELSGNYYGYNFSQTDDIDRVLSEYAEAAYINGELKKGHYNSSAIIVNGNNANLDFSALDNLYVAGRAYIETSRTRTTTVSDDGKTATTSYIEVEGNSDVQTGESISVKSNQVAYMPSGVDKNGNPIFTSEAAFNSKIIDVIVNERGWVDKDNMTVSYEISGKTYTFLNFTSATASAEFFAWYANDLPNMVGYDQITDIANVREYSDFNVNDINFGSGTDVATVTTSGAYTSGALNVARNKALTVTGYNADYFGGGNAITNFNNKAKTYNTNYMEMKYTLQTIDLANYSDDILTEMTNLKSDIATMDGADVTPINYFLDFTKVNGSALNGTKIGNYYVWISDEDVTITAPTGSNGKLMGLVIAKGDVNFNDDTVKRFEGLVITGSKIKVDHQMDFVANAEIVKTILRTAEGTKGNTVGDYSSICEIFKDYNPEEGGSSESGTSIGYIEVGDVIQYENWKKNVE